MPQTISNQASLTYQYNGTIRTALSNIATTTLNELLTSTKTSTDTTYQFGQEIPFTINLLNSGSTPLSNVDVVDNLGTYNVGTNSVTPYTYQDNALLFINGVQSNGLTVLEGTNNVTFTIASIPASANAYILYTAIVNDYAPLATTSSITNTASITSDTILTPILATETLTVGNYADVTIYKAMTPSVVTDGSTLTYTFTLYNYGNIEATNVIIEDTFDPAPTNITVSVNGALVADTNYTYTGGVLTLPTGTTFALTVPPATITQDPTTGVITTSPGVTTVVVTGTI